MNSGPHHRQLLGIDSFDEMQEAPAVRREGKQGGARGAREAVSARLARELRSACGFLFVRE